MRSALDSEHGIVDAEDDGLQNIAAMSEHGRLMAEAMDGVAAQVGQQDSLDDSVKYRLGRSIARMEAALSTPGMFGRVALAQTMRDISPDLMDMLGAASVLPTGTTGSADDGAAEYLFRLALPMGIYGGTLEVFRNMIAQHALKLGRPSYGR
jgi:alkylation response protein AidB-like acyl-CoA dehydrogenase